MRNVIKLYFESFDEEVFLPIDENIEKNNKHLFTGEKPVETATDLCNKWSQLKWGGEWNTMNAKIVTVYTEAEKLEMIRHPQMELFPELTKTEPIVLEVKNWGAVVECDEFEVICFKELAIEVPIWHTPWDEEPNIYHYCGFYAFECDRGNEYAKDYMHSECPVCHREFMHQNPQNGWRVFAHYLHDGEMMDCDETVVCEKCWVEHLVKEGVDIDDMIERQKISATFFSTDDFEQGGYEEAKEINCFTVGCGQFDTVPISKFYDRLKELKAAGYFDRYKVLFDIESMAYGGMGGIVTMWRKPKKYYRVFDEQRKGYWATGYNSISMEELIEDFQSYIRGGMDCPTGEEGMTDEEYEIYFNSLLDTWDKIADWLQGAVLEESEEKFNEDDML